jgi:hypothetical protein
MEHLFFEVVSSMTVMFLIGMLGAFAASAGAKLAEKILGK